MFGGARVTATPDLAASTADMAPDPEWTQRYRMRLRAALEELVRQPGPIPLAEVQSLAAARVPLNDYDRSVTKTGAVRAWNNLSWLLTTSFEHAGWLHATQDGGFRAAKEGAGVLAAHPDPQSLYEAANLAYRGWDALRKAPLTSAPVDSETEIVHDGTGFAHARLATEPVLAAWRSGDSALIPGTEAWGAAAATALRDYLAGEPTPDGPMSGLVLDTARVLAAEALVLLVGPQRHGGQHQAQPGPQPADPGRRPARAALELSATSSRASCTAAKRSSRPRWRCWTRSSGSSSTGVEQPAEARDRVWDGPVGLPRRRHHHAGCRPGSLRCCASSSTRLVHDRAAPRRPRGGSSSAWRRLPKRHRRRENGPEGHHAGLQAEPGGGRFGTTGSVAAAVEPTTRAAACLAGPWRARPAEPGAGLGAPGHRDPHRRDA